MGSIVQSRFSQIDDSCSRIKAYRILSHIGPFVISIGTRQDAKKIRTISQVLISRPASLFTILRPGKGV